MLKAKYKVEKMIIGLTGGIGSGKTSVSQLFEQQGIDVVDADIVAREVVTKGSQALIQIEAKFGSDILLENGELNRATLRQLVFSDEPSRHWLNDLLHPLIRQAIIDQLKASTSVYAILVAPLLIENNLTKLVDRVLVVDVSPEIQLKRTCERDGSSEEIIKSIMSKQVSRQDRIAAADDIIDNNATGIGELIEQVLSLHSAYLKHCK